ncbi:MAG: hydrolase [Synergistaceae bacterium]|nr:hydrolase [Synergistaceae bacterium]MBQ9573757.1 hydrolase [Synergistaceae bacterium]
MYKTVNSRSSFLMMIDIQERLLPVIHNKDNILSNSVKLLTSARELSVPVIVSEQYPKGIGSTVPELKPLIPDDSPFIEKTEFSCCANQNFGDAFLNLRFNSGTKDTVILFGIETHICVLATAFDLQNKFNLNVVIAADSCGSRSPENHSLALKALRASGCLVVPSETVIYQLLGKAGTPQFKSLLPILK